MEYKFKVEAFIAEVGGAKRTTTLYAKYRRSFSQWKNYDYQVLEKIIRQKLNGADVTILKVEEYK